VPLGYQESGRVRSSRPVAQPRLGADPSRRCARGEAAQAAASPRV